MKIEFDPSNPQDVEFVQKLLNPVYISESAPVDSRVDIPVKEDTVDYTVADADADAGQPEVDEVDPGAGPAPERDKTGRVWDERIDSSNRKMTTSGEWQKRRNVDPETREQVIAELVAVDDAGPEETFTGTQGTTPPPPPPGADESTGSVNIPPPPGAQTDPPAPIPDEPDGANVEWGDVFQRTMAALQGQHLTQDQIDSKVREWGIDGFPALISRPEKWGLFLMELQID